MEQKYEALENINFDTLYRGEWTSLTDLVHNKPHRSFQNKHDRQTE